MPPTASDHQRGNHPLDLAPVAETDHVARAPAMLGTASASTPAWSPKVSISIAASSSAVRPAMKGGVIPPAVVAPLLSAVRTDGVNDLICPSSGWCPTARALMPADMTSPTPMAGGFFLALPIVVGFGWGLASGRALQGALVGLVVGLALALLVWAIDRRRRS